VSTKRLNQTAKVPSRKKDGDATLEDVRHERTRKRLAGAVLSLASKRDIDALHDRETGDLVFRFSGNTKLQILNVTGYEIWELRLPSGAVEYSNYAK
jgi:hypothetical protein